MLLIDLFYQILSILQLLIASIMEVFLSISSTIIEKLTLSIIDLFKQRLSKYIDGSSSGISDLYKKISEHLIEVSNWSERIQFYGMGRAKFTDSDTIKLSMLNTPRKFRSQTKRYKKYSEDSFLQNGENYLLFGDPGSGKTTTLKRLARTVLLSREVSEKDIYQYPLLIRLRELTEHTSIHKHIAKIFGLSIKTEKVEIVKDDKVYFEERTLINDEDIESGIPRILNETRPILLIDGLDEVPTKTFQERIEREIEKLARKLVYSKIILTCRSGNYTKKTEGFNVFEIEPLSFEQINSIAELWTKDSEGFFKQLESIPYRDLTDRPLLLCQLLFIYDSFGKLPEKPALIYKKATKLFLEEWDADRKVKRISEYSRFDPDTKHDFLAELSCLLTYKVKKKTFSEEDLIYCYNRMYDNYALPKNEAETVAKEIETHTGIIVEASNRNYEFSHLTLQEYLCADFIVRSPFSTNIRNYILNYTPPLAVAVSLSADSSTWFAGLFLKHGNYGFFNSASLTSFLSRLLTEKAVFKPDKILGHSIICMLSTYPNNAFMIELIDNKNIRKSVSMAIKSYIINEELSRNEEYYHIHYYFKNEKNRHNLDQEFKIPETGKIHKKVLDSILIEFNLNLIEKTSKKGNKFYYIDGKQFSYQDFIGNKDWKIDI